MGTLAKLPGCDTCSVTVQSNGDVVHEPSCVTIQNEKHKNLLRKIGHAIKEAGIDFTDGLGNAIGDAKFGGE